ncbi:related to cyclin B3 [Rhynchosporium agropyri]|uniref:Related to cyclin B3 n=1 Tax=Rhynchosporium agropyri TaxID=914238 RepID=A0A1E1LLR7_9HELO|nr:related to cyclin B3 [Rhynchosporium agropyri]
MNAQPQRPGQKGRVQADENTAPTQAKQTLHQRHKSTGTLISMATTGVNKAEPKRKAFGDLSNTTRPLAAYDDSALPSKQGIELVKPAIPFDTKPTLLRPAQRPLNTAASKALLTSITTVDPVMTSLTSKLPLADGKQVPAALKRTFSKKSTTIYKDEDSENVAPQVNVNQVMRQEVSAVAPIHQSLETRKSYAQLQQGPPASRLIEPSYPVVTDNVELNETIYQDAEENPAGGSNEQYADYAELHSSRSVVEQYPGSYRDQRKLPALPEPEEYWEDDEEEVYDEQGYTTAHSYRSRGDTTGGVTIVLAPKVTLNVRREIAAAKSVVESSRTMEEIEDEAWDTSMVAEYGDEIFQYMRELENKMLPNANYMDTQTEIQWSMRSVLMDWLIQVHHRFSLLPETLFLCVNYIDRFLSCKIVSLGKLQLVGATAIFVAAKYEEINCPSVNEIVYMVDGGYTVDEILKAERFMLSMLQFELGWPGPMSFLRRISKADDYDLETRTLAKYFLEVTIMDERFVGSPPSYVAAGAHCFARTMLKKGDWSPAHVYYSGYTWTQLKPIVSMMLECCENPLKHHAAVFEKYSDRRYKRASQFVQAEMSKGFRLPAMYSRPSLASRQDFEGRDPFFQR